jgi:hypothetical protein
MSILSKFLTKIVSVFWDVVLYGVVSKYQLFRRMYCHSLEGKNVRQREILLRMWGKEEIELGVHYSYMFCWYFEC